MRVFGEGRDKVNRSMKDRLHIPIGLLLYAVECNTSCNVLIENKEGPSHQTTRVVVDVVRLL